MYPCLAVDVSRSHPVSLGPMHQDTWLRRHPAVGSGWRTWRCRLPHCRPTGAERDGCAGRPLFDSKALRLVWPGPDWIGSTTPSRHSPPILAGCLSIRLSCASAAAYLLAGLCVASSIFFVFLEEFKSRSSPNSVYLCCSSHIQSPACQLVSGPRNLSADLPVNLSVYG